MLLLSLVWIDFDASTIMLLLSLVWIKLLTGNKCWYALLEQIQHNLVCILKVQKESRSHLFLLHQIMVQCQGYYDSEIEGWQGVKHKEN